MYCTIDDMKLIIEEDTLNRLLALLGTEEDSVEDELAADTLLEDMIDLSTAEVRSYLDSRYGEFEDIGTVPKAVRTITATIAICFLYQRQTVANEYYADLYSKTLSKLRDISKGIAMLPVDPEEIVAGMSFTSQTRREW